LLNKADLKVTGLHQSIYNRSCKEVHTMAKNQILLLEIIFLFLIQVGCISGFSVPAEVERLTENGYQDVFPKIVIDNAGKVAVFWLSLEMRTPIIKGRFLSTSGWSKEQEFGACVGHWDVTSSPKGGFLLVRTHWGDLYATELMVGGSGKQSLISSGMISSPSVLTTGDKAYIIWQRKISEENTVIEGATYRSNNWSSPIQILTIAAQPIIHSFILGIGDTLLLVAVLKEDKGSGIYWARLSEELQIKAPLTKLRDLSVDYPNVEGTTAPNGSFWLAWEDGAEGEEQIYVSSSPDGASWSQPEMISPGGNRNLGPAIAADQGVYVIWTSFDQDAEEQYGRLQGQWRQLGMAGWQEIKGLSREGRPVLGRDVAIAIGQGRIWLTWEWKEEIYVLLLTNKN
jgi:hypothetical protein